MSLRLNVRGNDGMKPMNSTSSGSTQLGGCGCGCGQSQSKTLDLLLVGAPGSGKGTQAARLSQEFGIPQVATGDLFRENLKHQTPLGKLAKDYMTRGVLVPDDLTTAMVEERLSRPDAQAGFILDGFPRSLAQAESLTAMLAKLGRRIRAVLYVKVSDELILARLSGRLLCRRCQTPYHKQFMRPKQEGICDACGGELYQRDDDKPETIRKRLQVFAEQTAPVIDYYSKSGTVVEVDGEQELSEVTDRLVTAVRAAAPK